MKKNLIILSVLILSWVFAYFAFSQEENAGSVRYNKAVNAYYDKDYDTALALFSDLASTQKNNGYLYYNLGNCYYKMGKLGLALKNYEKALLFIPRNPDLKTNLNLARAKLTDHIEESFSDYLLHSVYFWLSILNLFEHRIFLVFLSVLFWGFVFFKYFRHTKFLSTNFVIFCFVFVYFNAGYCLKKTTHEPGQFGIILAPEIDVRASYLEKDQPLFQLHEGTKVRVIDQQDFGEKKSWLKIKMPQGQVGWVLADVVGII